jgi:hypothetical protein
MTETDATPPPAASLAVAVEAAKQFFRDNPDADAFTCVVAPPPVAA